MGKFDAFVVIVGFLFCVLVVARLAWEPVVRRVK
jgi:hypothetical protein